MPDNPALVIVIPVYNEEKQLPGLLRDWLPLFKATALSYKVILIDDGSKDNSLSLLKTLQANDPALSVHSQPNAGHGAAILNGYRMAGEAEWVFQIDSDHQFEPAAFRQLWDQREGYDLLLAERKEKNASLPRQCISAVSKGIVYAFYGRRIRDANSPYRLMRGQFLKEALKKIPENSFAPNILLSAWFLAKKSRIFTTVVESRKGDLLRKSKISGYFFKGALQSAVQTILFRVKV